MRRLFVLSVLAMGLGGGVLKAQPAKKKVPPKKPAAGQPAARPLAQTSVRKPVPTRTPAATEAEITAAGHQAAAAAAAERVHAWLRDHGEIPDDDAAPAVPARPAPVRRPTAAAPATATGKSTLPPMAPTGGAEPVKSVKSPAPAPASAEKSNEKRATTDDFLKAAEQRKALEEKEKPATGVSHPPDEEGEPQSELKPLERVQPEKPVIAEKSPAKAPAATKPVPVVELDAAAAAERVHAWMRAHGELPEEKPAPTKPVVTQPADEDDEEAPAPAKKLEVAQKPDKPLPDAKAAVKALEAKAREDAPTEKEARQKASAPVLAVRRAEPVEEEPVASTVVQPKLTFRRGRLVVPAPLLGSRAILVHQNEVADKYGLERVQDDDDLLRLRKTKDLVALPDNAAMQVDDRLAADRRYARPWVIKFLNDLGHAHQTRFHGPLQVNSAVRTVEFQQRLLRTNGNAAPAEGDTASPHLTGQAIDLAKHGLSMTEIAWLRAYLLPLVQQGKIDVEEEFQQACFHISVYKTYAPEAKKPAKGSRNLTKALAVAVP